MLNEINLSRIDLNLFVLFEAVVEERHVGRASERLALSASAVSHGLGRLRRMLGDPLFLRTPKGVVPTARAEELWPAIADILARSRSVLATAEPFDARTSTRRFTIGAPDGVSAVFVPPLLAYLGEHAPGIDLSIRQLLPAAGERDIRRAWRQAFEDLDARVLDIAVVPTEEAPARFEGRGLYAEDFVIAMRQGHPFGRAPTLDHYCELQHVVTSVSGDPHGFVDDVLAQGSRSRRIAITVPNFMLALAVVADTELVAAVPRQLASVHAERLGISSVDAPLPAQSFALTALATKSAMKDSAVAWMVDALEASCRGATSR